ncbi:MAG: quinolinate synthase NadA [Armatimonadetes bacterium]|nr:quinolinate synthase NadA [Armatimonadota bacterium]
MATPTTATQLDAIFDRVKRVIPPLEWEIQKPLVARILELKQERNAAILAHTYQVPEIYHTIADIQGDSLQLAREAMDVSADVIVMCGVRFMAETAKILNPSKTVLLPDLRAGCSMANSITADDVRRLKAENPGVPVVTYVNTNADVKAESDICCTSSNARQVVESLGVDKIIFIPDPYLGKWVQSQLPHIQMVLWNGPCEVHIRFTGEQVRELKQKYPGMPVLVHPECPEDVIAEADYTGSTSGMSRWVGDHKPARVALITECTMADNVSVLNPGVEMIRPCNLCPHMQRISLRSVVNSLERMEHTIEIEENIRVRAKQSLDRMLTVRI